MAWLATENLSGIHRQTLEVPARALTFATTAQGARGDCECSKNIGSELSRHNSVEPGDERGQNTHNQHSEHGWSSDAGERDSGDRSERVFGDCCRPNWRAKTQFRRGHGHGAERPERTTGQENGS